MIDRIALPVDGVDFIYELESFIRIGTLHKIYRKRIGPNDFYFVIPPSFRLENFGEYAKFYEDRFGFKIEMPGTDYTEWCKFEINDYRDAYNKALSKLKILLILANNSSKLM